MQTYLLKPRHFRFLGPFFFPAMESALFLPPAAHFATLRRFVFTAPKTPTLFIGASKFHNIILPSKLHTRLVAVGSARNNNSALELPVSGSRESQEACTSAEASLENGETQNRFDVLVGSPTVPPFSGKTSLSDHAFFLLAFIACTTSVAFTSLVIAAIPTLRAMGRAATSLSKLAETASEELPSTMAAIRLSGMEISDLTLELSDLSQEIADGVTKSTQAVQAAEAGIRKIGSLARQQAISMIQERASLPIISLQPVVAGAARKTSRAVGQATKTFMNMISRGELSSEYNDDMETDGVGL